MRRSVCDTKVKRKRIGLVPDSFLLFSHSARGSPDPWTTRPAFVLRPSAAGDSASFVCYPWVLHQCGGCAPDSRTCSPLAPRSDCHRLYPNISAEDSSLWVWGARPRSPRGSAPRASDHGGWLAPRLEQAALRSLRSAGSAWSHFWRAPWGWDRWPHPRNGLSHDRIHRLPAPLDAPQLLTLLHE